MMFLAPFLFIFGQWGMGPGPGMAPFTSATACGSYVHYRTITIPAQTGLSGNLTNYTFPVSGTYSYLATVANGGLVQNASGFDVGFFTDTTCTTKLNWEVETYSAASGAVNYWVKVPTLSSSVSTTVIMAYDNPSVTTDQSNKTGTWGPYWAVYHLGGTSSISVSDSTSSGNTLSVNGTPTLGTGKIDGDASWPGGAFLSKTTPTNQPIGNAARSMGAWINYSSFAGTPNVTFMGTDSGSPLGYGLYLATSKLTSEFDSGAGKATGATTLSTGTWYYVVTTYDGSTNKVYVNGTLDGSTAYSSANTGTTTLNVAAWANGCCQPASGSATDEARFANVALSADWILTDYNSQSSPATFYSVGTQH